MSFVKECGDAGAVSPIVWPQEAEPYISPVRPSCTKGVLAGRRDQRKADREWRGGVTKGDGWETLHRRFEIGEAKLLSDRETG